MPAYLKRFRPDFDTTPFHADLTTYNLGSFLLGRSHASPQSFRRDRQLASAVGVDHLVVQLYVSGECEFEADGHISHGKAGDVVCFDMSRQMSSRSSTLDTVSIVLPRELVRLAPRTLDTLHGAVLDGETTFGTLLREHLMSLARVAPRIDASESRLAAEVTGTLISASLSAAVSGNDATGADLVGGSLQAIQSYIERNLNNEALSPEMVMRHFGLSRSALYRTFEALGGVAEYIRDRRLDRAFLRLTSAGTGRGGVSKLAFACGFSSEAAFSRAFRLRFGMPPREAMLEADRRTLATGHLVDTEGNWLQAWLDGLTASGARA
ncbi:helix-turn-helix domain-containing protein [Aminobacter sp. UC22_36]|uniref:helix-turn-helix domain-containing protein n=1 Tax=Aminobacter sp. UC22_36 TaxID=3374549 RepID=UPI0037574F15